MVNADVNITLKDKSTGHQNQSLLVTTLNLI